MGVITGANGAVLGFTNGAIVGSTIGGGTGIALNMMTFTGRILEESAILAGIGGTIGGVAGSIMGGGGHI